MSDYLVQQMRSAPNIEVRLGAEIVGAQGGDLIESIAIEDRATHAVQTVPVKLLFVLIGAIPHTDWLAGTIQCDAQGFIVTGHDMDMGTWPIPRAPMTYETSVPGVFAAGVVAIGRVRRE
jgi:thioredoxin reductase (NADPH)